MPASVLSGSAVSTPHYERFDSDVWRNTRSSRRTKAASSGITRLAQLVERRPCSAKQRPDSIDWYARLAGGCRSLCTTWFAGGHRFESCTGCHQTMKDIMTRINLVPVEELMDQHLFSEFREIKMVPKSLRRSLAARGTEGVLKMIPKDYTLNKGHVSFFYDKAGYLMLRYQELREELCKRGINFDRESKLDPDLIFDTLGSEFLKCYTPTANALAIIRERIEEKLALRPGWYRYYGKVKQ